MKSLPRPGGTTRGREDVDLPRDATEAQHRRSPPNYGAVLDRAGRPVEVRPTHPGPAPRRYWAAGLYPNSGVRRRRGAAGLPDILERLATSDFPISIPAHRLTTTSIASLRLRRSLGKR